MAILPQVPGVEVPLKVDGNLVRDYEDKAAQKDSKPPSEHPQGFWYVEARTGCRFRIHVDVNEQFFPYLEAEKGHATCLEIRLEVDGKRLGKKLWPRYCRRPEILKTDLQHGLQISEKNWQRRDLIFTAIDRVDTPDPIRICRDRDFARHLGTIKVHFLLGRSSDPSPFHARNALGKIGSAQIAEQALKGANVAHTISIDSHHETIERNASKFKSSKILCVFEWAYRSRETLEDLLIIPRSVPGRPHFGSMSHEELVALAESNWEALRKIEEEEKPLLGQPARIKDEPSEGDIQVLPLHLAINRDRKRVKMDLTED